MCIYIYIYMSFSRLTLKSCLRSTQPAHRCTRSNTSIRDTESSHEATDWLATAAHGDEHVIPSWGDADKGHRNGQV